ncbi:MAG: multicopper oxidase domain-containing protein [Bacteroidetes bacterium]|nr:multicopper oxidase domain-containing protein [Bacteroidota bacterium]
MKHGLYQFIPGTLSATKGFNGDILGPTLIMQAGQQVCMNVTNHIGEQSTVHWHGLHVLAENDGGPHTVIDPNTTWSPCFKVMNKAGTYWYHPHLHELTNKHVTQGLSGLMIVRSAEESALNLPRQYGIDDFPLIIQTRAISSNGTIQFDISPSTTVNNYDTYLTVNAVKDAALNVPAQYVRFRILNGSKQRVFNLGLSNNANFYQIGSDGGLLASKYLVNRIRLAPGERVEIAISFASYSTGTNLQLMSYGSELPNGTWGAANAFSEPNTTGGTSLNPSFYSGNPMNGADFDILKFNVVAQTSSPVLSIPSSLATLNPIAATAATVTRDKYFFNVSPGPRIGAVSTEGAAVAFNMNTIDEQIDFNNIEIWRLHGSFNQYHPFHIHDVQFYVLDRKDSNNNYIPLTASEQGLKDVIYVGPKETVRIIMKFNDFWSDVPYMYHCHITHHEDRGMMKQFIVTHKLYVDKNSLTFQLGTESNPYYTATTALSAAQDGTTIYFKSNGNHEEISPGSSILTQKKVTLKVLNGDVIIK